MSGEDTQLTLGSGAMGNVAGWAATFWKSIQGTTVLGGDWPHLRQRRGTVRKEGVDGEELARVFLILFPDGRMTTLCVTHS